MPIDKLSGNSFSTGAIANSLGYTPANKAGDNFTGNVGILEPSPDLALHVSSGSNGPPANTGSTPAGYVTLRRKAAGATHGLNMGVTSVSPFGSWLQAQDSNNLATNYPISINPNGGNVGIGTLSPAVSLDIGSRTDAIKLPVGNTSNRPTGSAGLLRYNTELKGVDYHDGTNWQNLSYSDPYWTNVVLYLRGGSLTDLSGRHTASAVNVSTSSAPGKPFATAPSSSWYYINNGTNNYVDVAGNLGDFGPVNYTNFTIEFWLYNNQQTNSYGHFYNIGGQSAQGVIKFSGAPSSYGAYWYSSSGEFINWGANGSAFGGQWAWMVYEKYGSTNTTWVNGTRVSQNTNTFPAGTPSYLRLGGPFGTEYAGHYFDELRVTTAARYKGIATIPMQTQPWNVG